MTISYIRDDDADINGTSYHNVCVNASLQRMIEKFGPPMPGEGYKTKHEWTFRGPSKDYNVAVYDYRYDGSISGEWHVGATSYDLAMKFVKWFNSQVT